MSELPNKKIIDNNAPEMLQELNNKLKSLDYQYYGLDEYYENENGQCYMFLHDGNTEAEYFESVNGIYVDADDDEYTIYGYFHHEHLTSDEATAKLLISLLKNDLIELVLKIGTQSASGFYPNLHDFEKNALQLINDFDNIGKYMKEPIVLNTMSHMHIMYNQTYPYQLRYGFDESINSINEEAFFAMKEIGLKASISRLN